MIIMEEKYIEIDDSLKKKCLEKIDEVISEYEKIHWN